MSQPPSEEGQHAGCSTWARESKESRSFLPEELPLTKKVQLKTPVTNRLQLKIHPTERQIQFITPQRALVNWGREIQLNSPTDGSYWGRTQGRKKRNTPESPISESVFFSLCDSDSFHQPTRDISHHILTHHFYFFFQILIWLYYTQTPQVHFFSSWSRSYGFSSTAPLIPSCASVAGPLHLLVFTLPGSSQSCWASPISCARFTFPTWQDDSAPL